MTEYKFPLPPKYCPHCNYSDPAWKWCVIYIGSCPKCSKSIEIKTEED